MPQVIDYAGRFEQIREAVFVLTLRDGAHAVTMSAVAAEMGVSRSTLCRVLADSSALAWLGREIADRQERTRRLLYGPKPRPEQADWERYFEELAWLLPLDEISARSAVVRWRLSEQYAARDERLREADASRTESLDELVHLVVTACDPDPDSAGRIELLLRALVDGVTARVCRGQLDPDEARELLSSYVAGLAGEQGRRVA
jgi:AcrR family transcriptional regulator